MVLGTETEIQSNNENEFAVGGFLMFFLLATTLRLRTTVLEEQRLAKGGRSQKRKGTWAISTCISVIGGISERRFEPDTIKWKLGSLLLLFNLGHFQIRYEQLVGQSVRYSC